ncbi:MAG TPA: hypothetical protein VFG04_21840 [Planctomycetaceae bacterium]|nr:hypothetical protein [Planctomycetaceae bacterium]
MKDYSPFGRATPTVILLGALLVAALRVPLAGDSSFGVAVFNCDWQIEPSVIRTYDVGKAIERIAAVEPPEKTRAGRLLYWTAVSLIKGSTARYAELANDRKWDKDHLTLEGVRLTVLAPLKVQAELARNIRAWEQAGLSQISVGARLIFQEREPASKMFLGTDNRMVVINDQQALDLTRATEGDVSTFFSPKVTTFSGQQVTFVCPLGRSVLGPANQAVDAKQSRETIPGDEIKLTWRAIENHDLTRIRLEGSVEVGTATSATSTPTAAGNAPTPAGHPDVDGHPRERKQLSFNADLPDGQAMLSVRIPTRDGKRSFYVVLTVRRLIPPLLTETRGAPPAAAKRR